ncbi:MAG: hypothetical protein J6I68_11230 [Butyrivibrio sp.]|uniref:hypothetical protein n=1 Tax=Butyrivibrio sp. TaxID=28121 RepID=UPI001B65399E|nr:hypothetical protein [Butyrivibrio sp.]MBP3783807.1 hypothetical protein [Butyrivibrio sp.]
MSFDISKLTSAVNKYLNSISEISSAAQKAQQEIADRTQFSTELSTAIQQNIESRMQDQVTIPDIGNQVQDTVETQIKQAVSAIDNTFEQVNGAFEEIRQAGVTSAVQDSTKTAVAATDTATASANKSLANQIATSSPNKSLASQVAATNTNRDAYRGTLSTEALQDLSKSQYFSANLIQDSLFKEDNGSDSSSTSSATSAFDGVSLSDLNTNSLLANALSSGVTNSGNASALTQIINEAATASGNIASSANSSDLAKALIKAYTTGTATASPTSIFGDFTL